MLLVVHEIGEYLIKNQELALNYLL